MQFISLTDELPRIWRWRLSYAACLINGDLPRIYRGVVRCNLSHQRTTFPASGGGGCPMQLVTLTDDLPRIWRWGLSDATCLINGRPTPPLAVGVVRCNFSHQRTTSPASGGCPMLLVPLTDDLARLWRWGLSDAIYLINGRPSPLLAVEGVRCNLSH